MIRAAWLAALAAVVLTAAGAAQVEEGAHDAAAAATAAAPLPPTLVGQIELVAADAGVRAAGERFRDFVELYYRYTLEHDPELATSLGEDVGQDRWSDYSVAALKRTERETARAFEVLATIDRGELAAGEQLDYDLLHRAFEDTIRGQAFPNELLPITQMSGLQQFVPQTLASMPRRTVADYEDVRGRLDALPKLVEQTLVLLQRGLAQGVTPPRVTLRDVPQQVLSLLADEPLDSPLLEPFREFPGTVPAAEQRRLQQAAEASFRLRVRPAVEKLHRFLTLTYLPRARTTIAARDLPDGEAWYAYLVRQSTTTDLTPREIHDLGQREVERIRGEMEKVTAEIGFTGDLAAFAELLRTHSGFFYDDPEEMLRDYRDIAKRADAALPRLFGLLPRLPYGVEPMPPAAAPSQTAAYYEAGSLAAGRAGTFYVNTYDLKSRPKWRMESLTLHEAVPGHHLETALARERDDLPWFRRLGGYPAFHEGWALYAEGLGDEMGFYRDPYQKIGQLSNELWRALRLVVDTGLHAFGWSRQQAIDYLLENTGRSEHEVIVEVDRYIVWPGQALAYKIGELKIRELRVRAERRLGARFDVRDFHDAVLAGGALPLAVLEKRIDAWTAARQ